MDSKNINYAERSALIFKEGQLEKIREKGLKTGNSLVMQAGNCAILDQNFGKYLVLDIQLQSIFIIRKYSLKSENVD